MRFKLDEGAIGELFGRFSFRKLVDPEGLKRFLNGYADMVKEDRLEDRGSLELNWRRRSFQG